MENAECATGHGRPESERGRGRESGRGAGSATGWEAGGGARALRALACGLVVLGCAAGAVRSARAQEPEPGSSAPEAGAARGEALFESRCAACHGAAAPAELETPRLAQLREFPPAAILSALTDGSMREQAAGLDDAALRRIAEFAAGRALAAADAEESSPALGLCAEPGRLDPSAPVLWRGWSPDERNTRFQSAEAAGLVAEQLPGLQLRWAFGFPDASSARALPTVAGDWLFVGSQSGAVYALDAQSGCTRWRFDAAAGVRTAIAIGAGSDGATRVFFGDLRANVYALDAASGELLWQRELDAHPAARITGSPTYHDGRLIVPVSSVEEGSARRPGYACCVFRGSVAALDAASGETLWQSYTLDEPQPIREGDSGPTRLGPSGAAVWSSPTVDAARRRVYVGTGNQYTEPPQDTSDAVLAFDLDTGERLWSMQATAGDVYVLGCGGEASAGNCPEELGPDLDFGSSPALVRLADGSERVVAGQKAGLGWALDPDREGAVLWRYRAGAGGPLGGIQWGIAADSEKAYFPVSDLLSSAAGGLHAVQLATGERAWAAPPAPLLCEAGSRGCSAALSAAITVMPGAVLTGSMDGGVRIYSSADGALLWEYDTNREFDTVNGVPARGASINGPGPMVAGGLLYVNSGYGGLGGRRGNVLLAFGPAAEPVEPPSSEP